MHANDVKVAEDDLVTLSTVRDFFNRLLFFSPDNKASRIFNWVTMLLILGVVIASMSNTVKDIHAVWGSQIVFSNFYIISPLFALTDSFHTLSAQHLTGMSCQPVNKTLIQVPDMDVLASFLLLFSITAA